ncbi:MAG: carbonic anhydrase [Myxococcota bacterium]|nr:carbonic anhydrase [Myxococcota bacterium]
MKKLVTGYQRFRDHSFEEHRELFAHLGGGQSPQALFITCSDSRINPNLLTQTNPGDLFILRNAGNIVPPHGATPNGEAATIEYAIEALGVRDIVVCGHSQCGAMKALLDPPSAPSLSAVRQWLTLAEPTRRVIERCYGDRDPEEKINVAIQENVLQQLVNLRTLPCVASHLAAGDLRLHAWVYQLTTGEVFSHDMQEGQFRPLTESANPAVSRRALDGGLFGP